MNSEKKYVRDKRSPIPSSDNASKVLSAIKAKNTKPELQFRKLLWKNGIKGYRLHPKTVEGRPDITFISKKVALFIHGCYWHRYPQCKPHIPKFNKEFWVNKFQKNIKRDQLKEHKLKNQGWKILVFWECEIKANPETLLKQIISALGC